MFFCKIVLFYDQTYCFICEIIAFALTVVSVRTCLGGGYSESKTTPICAAARRVSPVRTRLQNRFAHNVKPIFHGACFGAVSAPTLYAP